MTSEPRPAAADVTHPVGGAADDPRIAPLTAALAPRLRAVCRGWNSADFDALVERIARTKLRWSDLGYGE